MPRNRILALIAFALVALAVFAFVVDTVSLDWLKAHRDEFMAYCEANTFLAIAVYSVVFIIWGSLCIPGVVLLVLAGGMVFGLGLGVLVATLNAVVAATIAFLIARHLLFDFVHTRFKRTFVVIDRGVADDGAFYVFMMRLIIAVPYFLINPLMGLTAIRLRAFVLATLLGMLVNTYIWVNAGTALGRIDSLDDVLSWEVAIALALIGLLPLVGRRLMLRRKRP
ncbi:MAG: TVP38/TMEM64 family protein [Burkholderiales bacterium]